MEVNYRWQILQLDCSPSIGEYKDYVIGIHCLLIGEYNDIQSSYPWLQSLSIHVDNPSYKPYNDLTEEDVIGWLNSEISEEQYNEMKFAISDAIQQIISPSVIVLPLPWANN